MTSMGNTGTTRDQGQTGSSMPSAMNPAHQTPTRHVHFEETKSAFKTTELIAYVLTVVAITIMAVRIGGDQSDAFGADKAMTLITVATVGYLLSRGLAKGGSRHRDSDH